ncbi:uncharacterized protein N7477_005258 [Penicillium maclennaniae]|uniref:uncharacterized protein n=1 Tax=Penicillium maclennaniae TaxID=1343394 RepID=UPI0025416749|nr:uncharacterized protein N7477_005258 [Penicillium maclennaniae]KAJ5669895.1 hypothetical protein N7477_005258 [Penicillium maclennaniae]
MSACPVCLSFGSGVALLRILLGWFAKGQFLAEVFASLSTTNKVPVCFKSTLKNFTQYAHMIEKKLQICLHDAFAACRICSLEGLPTSDRYESAKYLLLLKFGIQLSRIFKEYFRPMQAFLPIVWLQRCVVHFPKLQRILLEFWKLFMEAGNHMKFLDL